MTEDKPNTSSIFHTDFLPFAIRWGRGLSLFGIVLAFGPCLGLAVMGIFPSVSGVMAGIAAQLPAVVAAYFYEPISYFAILGIAGTYMGFLSGNVNNMRAPCASIAQSAANVEEGSDEGGIIATVGIAVSIFINIAFLTVGVIVGNYVVSLLPQHVLDALNLLLPALFGALFANQIVKKPKLALVALPITGIMILMNKLQLLSFLPGKLVTPIVMPTCVFGTMGIGLFLASKGKMD